MTNEEALLLAKQGFTAEEIKAFGWSATAPDGGKAPEDDKAPEDNKTPEGGKEPEDKKEPENDALKALTETVNALTETVKGMQEANQKTAKKTRNDNAPKSADEVVKSFIESM